MKSLTLDEEEEEEEEEPAGLFGYLHEHRRTANYFFMNSGRHNTFGTVLFSIPGVCIGKK